MRTGDNGQAWEKRIVSEENAKGHTCTHADDVMDARGRSKAGQHDALLHNRTRFRARRWKHAAALAATTCAATAISCKTVPWPLGIGGTNVEPTDILWAGSLAVAGVGLSWAWSPTGPISCALGDAWEPERRGRISGLANIVGRVTAMSPLVLALARVGGALLTGAGDILSVLAQGEVWRTLVWGIAAACLLGLAREVWFRGDMFDTTYNDFGRIEEGYIETGAGTLLSGTLWALAAPLALAYAARALFGDAMAESIWPPLALAGVWAIYRNLFSQVVRAFTWAWKVQAHDSMVPLSLAAAVTAAWCGGGALAFAATLAIDLPSVMDNRRRARHNYRIDYDRMKRERMSGDASRYDGPAYYACGGREPKY
ncbi:MAG: hypothetical protein Q4B30_03150 [Coriobacteriaceae bacterium]|nr:hypothetical protein [Coriobacteriaceae bacterium]